MLTLDACPADTTNNGECVTFTTVKADAVLNLRVPTLVKEALARAAGDNLRTMSSMATWALAEWLSEHGYLDRPQISGNQAPRRRTGG